jgi:hypothetical protein
VVTQLGCAGDLAPLRTPVVPSLRRMQSTGKALCRWGAAHFLSGEPRHTLDRQSLATGAGESLHPRQ